MPDKLPPHNNEAEDAVIASIVIDESCLSLLVPLIKPGDFLQEKARYAYEAILSLHQRQMGIDQLTVFYELERQGKLTVVGRDWLSRIIAALPTSVHAVYYARIVSELAGRRKVIQESAKQAAAAYEGRTPTKRKWGQEE